MRSRWLDRLPSEQARVFRDALAGFYKACGVDVVREQVESALRPGMRFMVCEHGLIVETEPHFEAAARYDLDAEGLLVPQPLDGRPLGALRPSRPSNWYLIERQSAGEDWMNAWDNKGNQSGPGEKLRFGATRRADQTQGLLWLASPRDSTHSGSGCPPVSGASQMIVNPTI